MPALPEPSLGTHTVVEGAEGLGFRNNRVVSTFIFPGFRILAVSIPQDINPYLKTFALNPNP